jgi:hypothetical protein
MQLVQALRFEAFDDSRLARFLVARAAANPAFAIFLHWWVQLWQCSALAVPMCATRVYCSSCLYSTAEYMQQQTLPLPISCPGGWEMLLFATSQHIPWTPQSARLLLTV